MKRRPTHFGLFFQEFLRTFHTTGAIAPSGRFLATALTRFVQEPALARQILEVGPGTGAVTRRIVAAMRPGDHLDLVELNHRFVERLRHRFQAERTFRGVAHRTRILHCAVEDLAPAPTYDLIISGVPLNNFSVHQVEEILAVLTRLMRPGGTLSFFEYIAVRKARALVSGRAERARLRRIAEISHALLKEHEFRRDWIWVNVPPAWVHHLRV